ncbi:hypothetical protein [Actinokineospora sp. HUAS TT18]|uniref:hypothetical protein n=1 Tax=Actinokineospora sp. HUAS TT18 TaxID=3447451 RepID=UPI003F51D439
MRPLIGAVFAVGLLAGCGSPPEPVAEPTSTSVTSTETTTTTTTTTTTETTTTTTTTTSEVEETTTTTEEPEPSADEPAESEWESILPGVWIAKLGYAAPAEELWTFNGDTGGALFQLWPRGFGLGNPLDNGVAGPASSGFVYSVSGDTLTVRNVLSTRVYTNLTGDGGSCFTADYRGYAVEFCRH